MDDARLTEKTLSRREVFAGRLLRVRVDEVELPDGSRTTREVVQHPGAVAMVPLLDSGEVVLVRQFRQPAGRALLEIPAGTLSPGEDPEACAVRELIEEISYRPTGLTRLANLYLAPGYSSEYLRLFLATGLQPAQAPADADERLLPQTLPLAEALAMVRRGEIEDAKTICGLLHVACWPPR